ncbi:beta strand repeat-containing protein, partial [Aquaspirillum serpens]|uniref:beta strand repeat-containing protein n=1 Tax=Aquaspirillum serpens TaxID=190 RepID=UPI0003B3E5AD
YVDSNKGNEISTSILDAVTNDAATVTTAIESLTGTTGGNEAGADRVLTTAQDILTGTAGNDNFRAVAGANTGNQDQTTLNSSDIIDGAAGNDTLIVNLVNGGAAANYGGGARIKNIETLKLGTNNNATFDYNVNQGQNEITDVTTIVADQINTGETLTIRNLVRDAADKALPTLSWINDSTAVNGLAGTVNAAYRAAAVSGTDDEQAINLTNVRAGTLNINAGIEKAVVASTGTSTNSIATIDSITGTNTTLKEVVINAEATAALGEGRIISTAAGTRGLEVARTPANDNTQHVSFVNVGSAVTKVDASGSKGNVNVAFTDTATAVANTFIGGEGNDQVVVNGGNDNLSGGKGNDTFIFNQTNTSANGTFFNNSDTIDGGEGTDTIQIDYAGTAALGQVVIQTSEWLNSKGLDALDLRAQNTRVQLDDAFVGRADAGSFEVITNKIVQNDSTTSVADEANSRHQIDLTTVTASRAVKVTGGEGRETVIVTDALNGMQTLSGGNGLDVLVVKNGATLTGQDLENVSGFNVMNLVKTSANAQSFQIDLTADFLTKAIDANAAAGTSVNTANLFRIVTDGADAFGNSLSGVQDIGTGDTINLTIDTTGLTAGSGAINVNDLLATAAAVNIRNASGQALVTKAAGVGGAITVAATAGNIFTAANATATADAAYTTTAAASVGSLTTSGQASTGGGAAPATGNTFTLTAGQDIVTSTSTNLAAQPGVFFSTGNDTVTGGAGLLNANDILVDASTTDADVLNGQLVGAITPTNWTNIETLNFEMLGDTTGFTNTTGVSLAGANGYKTIGVSGVGRTAHLDDVRSGTTVNVNSAMTVGVDMLTDVATDTLTVNLNGVTGATLDVSGGTNDINVLTINSNTSANTANITMTAGQFGTAATDQITIGGSQNLTLTAADNLLTAQRINATTNTGVVTLSSNTAGAATINANLMTGVDAFTFATSNNTVTLQNLANNAGGTAVNLSAAVTTLNLSAREAGGVVNVTASNDIDNVTVNAGSASLATINLNTGTGTNFTGGLTVNLATIGGNTPTLNLSGAGAASTSQAITLTAGNFNASGFTVNAAAATEGLTINGAATGTIITDSAKNDTITGAAGNDVINLTTGGNDQVRFAHDGAANVDTVNGFTVGAATTTANNDFIGLTAGAFTGSGLEATTFATGAIAATAAGVVTVYNQAVNTNANLAANTSQVMKLTSVVSTSWATAMGTSSLNVADGAVVTAIFFDATNGQAVVGIVNTETDNAAGDVLTSADTFVEIARIGMTAADYANFGTNQILFF